METKPADKAEHVSGIVLQPEWRIRNLNWTNRENVFECDSSQGLADENNFKGTYPLLTKSEHRKEQIFFKKQPLVTDFAKERSVPTNTVRSRQMTFRRRWI